MPRLLPLAATLILAFLLASCTAFGRGPIQRPLFYDVRDASVIAGEQVPLALLAGVDQRLSAAIAQTVRTTPTQRVVLTVRVTDYKPVGVRGDRRASARFRVTAADVETGNPVAVGNYFVHSTTDSPVMADQSLAEEIAARIRYAFVLQTPRVAVAKPKPRSSTRMKPQAAATPAAAAAAAVVPTDRATPAPAPAPSNTAAPAVSSGTNIEAGAEGVIRLGAPPAAACDPATDPACTPEGQ